VLAHSKAALIALALVISCSPVLAQGDPPNPPSDNHGAQDGMGHRGDMRRSGSGHDGDNWGQGRDGGDWGRGREGRGHGMGMHKGMRGREFGLGRLLSDPAMREQLGVSAEQAAKIRQQESDFRKTEIRGRADIEVKQIDLRDLLAADKPDRAAVDAKLQEISTSRLALQKSSIDFRLNSRDALTAAQREKLHQIMRDRHRPGGGPGSHGPRGMGQRGPGSQAKPQGQVAPSQ
jgi:Spy/CpxP family protein refolding chaperone